LSRSLGKDHQRLPKPVDLAALHVYLANLGRKASGVPAVHAWGWCRSRECCREASILAWMRQCVPGSPMPDPVQHPNSATL